MEPKQRLWRWRARLLVWLARGDQVVINARIGENGAVLNVSGHDVVVNTSVRGSELREYLAAIHLGVES